MVKREWYQDKYNSKKTWEVVKMTGGYYLRQYINGQQVNTGLRTTKAFIASIGIFEFERILSGNFLGSSRRKKLSNLIFVVVLNFKIIFFKREF